MDNLLLNKIIKSSTTGIKAAWTDTETETLTSLIDAVLANKVPLTRIQKFLKNHPEELEKNFPGRKPYTVYNYIKNHVHNVRPPVGRSQT